MTKDFVKPTVAILTNFMDFNPGYSLSGIVIDQAHMLAKNKHKVIIYVSEQYNDQYEKDCGFDTLQKLYPEIKVKKLSKFMHLRDYGKTEDFSDEHKALSLKAAKIYYDDFIKEGITIVFTHDFVFTGWNLPFAEAVKEADALLLETGTPVKWFHWIHSVPSDNKDWWKLDNYGLNHSLVFPNKTEIVRVAEAFQTIPNRVKIIPHIKDIRNWYDFGIDSMAFLEQYPTIIESDIIQVYPCSTDRMSAKQLHILLELFAGMKLIGGKKVFLIIANQWATGRQRKEDVDEYIKLGERVGLTPGKDFCFTSKTIGHEKGIGKKMLRELQLLSDVFIFPTREESFGLVGPEASFSGALPVINKSLTMMYEVMGNNCPAFEFGSFHNKAPAVNNPNYVRAVAMAILDRLYSDESVMTKAFCRSRYNMETLYKQVYLPLLSEIN